MIGTFAATLVAVVATIGILSRSGYPAKREQVREKLNKEIAAEAPGVNVIVLQAPGEKWNLSGELVIRGATGQKHPGMYSYPARLEAYLGKVIKGDTLFLSLGPAEGSPEDAACEIGRIDLTLYAGRVAEVVSEWRLHTVVTGLDADTLKLKTNAEVSLDGSNIRVFRVETRSESDVEK